MPLFRDRRGRFFLLPPTVVEQYRVDSLAAASEPPVHAGSAMAPAADSAARLVLVIEYGGKPGIVCDGGPDNAAS
jgi:hypothetical protein